MAVDIPDIPKVTERQSATGTSGPPNRVRAGSGRTPPAATTPPPIKTTAAEKKAEVLKEDLAQLYTLGGVMVSLVRPDIGTSMVDHGEEAAARWVELAEKNTRVRKALEDLTAASVWGAVIAVHVKMFAPAIAFLPKGDPTQPQEPVSFAGVDLDPNAMDLAMQMMTSMQGDGTPVADTL